MGLIAKYPPAEVKGKKRLGAIAAGVVPPALRDPAYSTGYFVLELTGESVALVPPPEDFTPKECYVQCQLDGVVKLLYKEFIGGSHGRQKY
jgi:hypothetical protein